MLLTSESKGRVRREKKKDREREKEREEFSKLCNLELFSEELVLSGQVGDSILIVITPPPHSRSVKSTGSDFGQGTHSLLTSSVKRKLIAHNV